MDFGSTTKPVIGPIAAAAPRADVAASFRSVPTQLPPEASVQQVSPLEAVRFEPSDGMRERAVLDQILSRALQRSTDIDARTKAVVHRVTDEATGEIVAQFPTEQVLKLRAYLREEAEGPRAGGRTA